MERLYSCAPTVRSKNLTILTINIVTLLQGCASISTIQNNHEITCRGIFYSETTTDYPLTAIKTSGAGIFKQPSEVTIGYLSELRIFQNEDSCKTIIIANNKKDIENIEKILKASGKNLNNICIEN